MHQPYNTTSLSGFVRVDSIQPGRLEDLSPVVKFMVFTGGHEHPIFIVDLPLALEVFTWYLSLQKHGVERVYVAATSSVYSNKRASCMVANFVDLHTSNPDARMEADQIREDAMAGKPAFQWPDTIIKMPVRIKPLIQVRKSKKKS